MAAFTNLSFEAAGASPGEASGWAVTVVSSLQAFADFSGGSGMPRVLESFELGWDADDFAYTLVGGVAALFDSAHITPANTAETFTYWPIVPAIHQPFLYQLASTEQASFSGEPVEAFEVGWGITTFETTFGPGDTESTSLTDFDVAGYQTTFGPGDTETALFNMGADELESFEDIFGPIVVTIDETLNVISAPAHGRSNGEPVVFASTGTLPAELRDVVVYIRDEATNTLKVAATPGGAALDITDEGTGTITMKGDPRVYWTEVLP